MLELASGSSGVSSTAPFYLELGLGLGLELDLFFKGCVQQLVIAAIGDIPTSVVIC